MSMLNEIVGKRYSHDNVLYIWHHTSDFVRIFATYGNTFTLNFVCYCWYLDNEPTQNISNYISIFKLQYNANTWNASFVQERFGYCKECAQFLSVCLAILVLQTFFTLFTFFVLIRCGDKYKFCIDIIMTKDPRHSQPKCVDFRCVEL